MAKRVNVQAHPSQLELDAVDSNILLELFPFAVVLDHDMRITRAGEKLIETWILHNPSKSPQSFYGSKLVDIFKLRRPKGLRVDWNTLVHMNLVMFELELMRCEHGSKNTDKIVSQAIAESSNDCQGEGQSSDATCVAEISQAGIRWFFLHSGNDLKIVPCLCRNICEEFFFLNAYFIFFNFIICCRLCASKVTDRRGSQGWTRVLLKGQMRYIADIDSIVFLCSPL